MYKQFQDYKPTKAMTALIVTWALIGGMIGGWFIHASAQSSTQHRTAVLESQSKDQ